MRLLLSLALLAAAPMTFAQEDPHLWLEDVAGDKQIAWAKEHSAHAQALLESQPGFDELKRRLLAVYTSRERIPTVAKRGDYLYNFWQDERHPRGILRRTTLAEYRKKEPAWETVLDIDQLSAAENEKLVFKGSNCLYPKYERCLVSLSRAGADAVQTRELDMVTKRFVKDGFNMPESKGDAEWVDADTLLVSRDFGPGTMTTSGYPRVVKEWKRGTPLAEARTLFEGEEKDVSVGSTVVHEAAGRYELIRRSVTFWEGENFIRRDGRLVKIDVPRDATVSVFDGLLVVRLRSDWNTAGSTHKAGSLISTGLDAFLGGTARFSTIFEPKDRVSLQDFTVTRSHLLLDVLDNVKSRLVEAKRQGDGWALRNVAVPAAASIGVAALDRHTSDDYWLTMTSFTEPTTLYLARAGEDRRERLKSLPAMFDARGLTVRQHEAVSRDGTRIPYFVVMRENAKLDGKNPTILYGYGGFEVSMTPSYSATVGVGWLERGGVWVLANLRGGGEFGPEWHLTARREGRQKTHDDFIAVAEDIIRRGITSPRHLGIMGGSQGGLLVGAAFTQRPELFRAVVSQVPLLDMKRYHKLLAGASWMGEYGNPDDPRDWEFISKYSPYQNVRSDVKYPTVFLYTSTRDDRVHPAHARKMYARMKEQGHDVHYYEYTEGGHAAGSLPQQQAYTWALTYSFLRKELN